MYCLAALALIPKPGGGTAMRERLLVLLIATTCISYTSPAQTPAAEEGLRISGIQVSLGMSRDAVYELFKGAHIKVKELHFPDRKHADEAWGIIGNCAPES